MTGMIVSAARPLDATPGSVRALYVALNHPVVTVNGLPVGPASAGIALHGEGGATLMIRSSRSHSVVFFHAVSAGDPHLGAAAAFDHAEGMGFLFDEEMPLDGGDARAGWPAWLAEHFPAAEPDGAAFLSKFRWSLPGASDRTAPSAGRDAALHPGI